MAAKSNYVTELITAGGHRNSKALVTALTGMIKREELPTGARLPTVRALAQAMDISPSTVADAWAMLRKDGLIETRRRGGTVVKASQQWVGEGRGADQAMWPAIDLAQNMADPRLLPPLDKALLEGLQNRALHLPDREHITSRLRDAVAPSWPFAPQAWSTGAGGAEAAYLAFEAAAARGSKVAVEEPTAPRILDAMADLGFIPLAVACDADGPRPDRLAEAIDKGAKAFIYQPRAQLPLGHSVTAQRVRELAEVIRASGKPVNVVEDDNTGPLALQVARSIGLHLPHQIIHVRAYCKAYGTDLKTAVIGGASDLVLRTRELRSGGRAVSSRILQDALAYLVNDARSERRIATARERYAQRQVRMIEALNERGADLVASDGPVLWLPVANENAAMVRLAASGITVGAGSRCYVMPVQGLNRIRVATSRLPDDLGQISRLADAIIGATTLGNSKEYF